MPSRDVGPHFRVASFEGAPGYDFFKRNCEHFARKVVFGEERSPQIEVLIALGALVALVVLLSSARG